MHLNFEIKEKFIFFLAKFSRLHLLHIMFDSPMVV
jgi:hypothetical protein